MDAFLRLKLVLIATHVKPNKLHKENYGVKKLSISLFCADKVIHVGFLVIILVNILLREKRAGRDSTTEANRLLPCVFGCSHAQTNGSTSRRIILVILHRDGTALV